jgi:hypothetical protein
MNPPLRLLAAMQQIFNDTPPHLLQVPGRDMWIAGDTSDSHYYTLHLPDSDSRTRFDRRSARLKRTDRSRPLPRTAHYMAGVIVVLGQDKIDVPGFVAVLAGDEPAGPRYEYACGMAVAALSLELTGQPYDSTRLLNLMDRVQTDYINGG